MIDRDSANYVRIPCPDNKPGCLVIHKRRLPTAPEQLTQHPDLAQLDAQMENYYGDAQGGG